MPQPGAGKNFVPFGPCNVSWGVSTLNASTIFPVTAAVTLTLLGTGDATDGVTIAERWASYHPTVSDFGAEITLPPYNMGEVHRIHIPLIYCDINQLIALRNALRGTSADGISGKIGSQGGIITIQLESTLPGSQNRIYANVVAEDEALETHGFNYGQAPSRMLSLVARTNPSSPPAESDVCYTTSYN